MLPASVEANSTNYRRPYNYTDWATDLANQKLMTDVLIPKLEALTPGGGCYLNEADFRQPNWQQAFYGTHYKRLYEIKTKYDPDDIFYARTGVGSEFWTQAEDGRLCKSGINAVGMEFEFGIARQ